MFVAFNLHKIRSLGKKTTTTVIPQSIELSDKCRQTKCHFVFLAFIKTSSQKKFQSSQTTKIIPTKDKETHFSILQLLLFTSEAWVSSASDCRNYVQGVVLLVIIADCFKFKWLELKKKKNARRNLTSRVFLVLSSRSPGPCLPQKRNRVAPVVQSRRDIKDTAKDTG